MGFQMGDGAPISSLIILIEHVENAQRFVSTYPRHAIGAFRIPLPNQRIEAQNVVDEPTHFCRSTLVRALLRRVVYSTVISISLSPIIVHSIS